jgi:hypothetical protein
VADVRPPDSAIGRLLTELSWSGRSIRQYRHGGAGFENVLTAEVMQALDFLPRTAFLGSVLEQAHGAGEARKTLVREVEHAEVTVLPGDIELNPAGHDKRTKVIVQPDATIISSSVFALVEAKRIRRSSFQPEQLAREYVAVTVEAQASGHRPLLLLVLGAPPPVVVAGWPRPVPVTDAVQRHLASVVSRTTRSPGADKLAADVDDVIAWTTWREIDSALTARTETLHVPDPSVAASVRRLAASATDAIARHS